MHFFLNKVTQISAFLFFCSCWSNVLTFLKFFLFSYNENMSLVGLYQFTKSNKRFYAYQHTGSKEWCSWNQQNYVLCTLELLYLNNFIYMGIVFSQHKSCQCQFGFVHPWKYPFSFTWGRLHSCFAWYFIDVSTILSLLFIPVVILICVYLLLFCVMLICLMWLIFPVHVRNVFHDSYCWW